MPDIVIGANGDIHILERSDRTIRVFDRDGLFLRSIGGEGDGPGEFRRPLHMALSEDSLLVFERDRYHVFSLDGRTLMSGRYVDAPRGLLSVRDARWTEQGFTIVEERAGILRRQERFVDTMYTWRFDPSSGALDGPLWKVVEPDRFIVGVGVLSEMYAHRPPVGLAHDGNVLIAPTSAYEVSVALSDGALGRTIGRSDVERIAVTDAMSEAEIDRQVAWYEESAGPDANTRLRDMWNESRSLGHAEYRPIVGSIMTDRAGWMLVMRSDLDPRPFEQDDATPWDVFRPDGDFQGQFRAEPGVRLLTMDYPYVYGTALDELDITYVIRYEIVG